MVSEVRLWAATARAAAAALVLAPITLLVPEAVPDFVMGSVVGGAVGTLMRPAVRSARDFHVPAIAGLIAALSVGGTQLVAAMTTNDPPFVMYFAVSSVLVAVAAPLTRLGRFDAGDAVLIAQDDMRDLQARIERVEARPKPPVAVMTARIRCAGCDEMVDASTTTRDEVRGMLCPVASPTSRAPSAATPATGDERGPG